MHSKVEQLHSRADSLFAKFEQGGGTSYIGEAIVLDRQALELCPLGHPKRSVSLGQLAVHLGDRYNQLGAMMDLEEAIVLGREALEFYPPGHLDRLISVNNLAIRLSDRYGQLGAMEDLNEAIVLGREALDICPPGHPHRSACLINIAKFLAGRYKQLGIMEDLNETIVLGREGLNLCSPGHPLRSNSLNNLATDLSIRYKQLGAMEDLVEATVLVQQALFIHPPGHPHRPHILNTLANRHSDLYQQFGTMAHLDKAILLNQEAYDLCPPGHPLRPTSLNNLANRLSDRYKQLGAMEDLDEAIVLGRKVHDLCPPGHPLQPTCLNNLAHSLSDRYKQLGAVEDLNEAIVVGRSALSLCLPGHPARSQSLHSLAYDLRTRFTQSNQFGDDEELFSLYSELAHLPQTVSSIDLSAARAWVRAAENFQHPTIILAYETSLRLLVHHLATLPSLPGHLSVLRNLTSSLAVDAFSACLRKGAPSRAVELLEQGRGAFWSQLIRLRSPLHDVIASGPAGKMFADEFTQLTSLIRNAFNSPGAYQHDLVCCLNVELQRVVTGIRNLPGLSRFLLPSLFSELQCAASGGPVIIVNASQYGCDALVVLVGQDPVHIPLQITQGGARELSSRLHILTARAKRADVTRELASFLRELWDQVVSPIVDFLQTTHPSQSRIWWCPTAEFSDLPLHATGPYRKGQPNLADLYISSFTPTLTALIRARRPSPSSPTTEGKHFVAIGQAKAIGESELLSVDTELANVGQRVDGLTTFTRIEGPESCISRVSDDLRKNQWVHLACHGLPNRKEPFKSAFALHDGHFTIQHLIQCELENPEFAYLSACHTTVGDEKSPDEVIHLASAMQFVGFRSVIGTMWAVDDGQTNKITSMFYSNMMDESGRLDHTRAAFALHKTMRKMVDIPFDQRILYIHLGA